MPNGSRMSDAVSHGGVIATGSPNVLTESLPTARLTDLVACALHGVAVIAGSSSTVLVNGRGFARIGDGCTCGGGGGSAGPGATNLVDFLLANHGGDLSVEAFLEWLRDGLHGPRFERRPTDGGMEFEGALAGFEQEGALGHLRAQLGRVEGRLGYREGPLGLSFSAGGEAHAAHGDAELNVTDEITLTAEGGLGNVKGGYQDVLLGDDGDRQGVALDAGLMASVAQGDIGGRVETTLGESLSSALGPFGSLIAGGASALSPTAREWLATPVTIEGKVGGSLLSVGGEANAAAYYDRDSGQTVFALGGALAALVGLGADVKITVGADRRAAGDGGGGGAGGGSGPNVIVAGSGTVLVGG